MHNTVKRRRSLFEISQENFEQGPRSSCASNYAEQLKSENDEWKCVLTAAGDEKQQLTRQSNELMNAIVNEDILTAQQKGLFAFIKEATDDHCKHLKIAAKMLEIEKQNDERKTAKLADRLKYVENKMKLTNN